MLLNLGSCSLHVKHGAFRYGALQTEWNLDGILRALWFTFHDSPARREDFTAITGSSLFPLKFWATCWLEDEGVAEHAIEISPHVKKYVKETLKEPKSKVPKCASLFIIQEAVCQDHLAVAK